MKLDELAQRSSARVLVPLDAFVVNADLQAKERNVNAK